jgi:recombinational DNA repair protein RecR
MDEFSRLPGIGPRTAQRVALHLIKSEDEDVARLARAIVEAKQKVRFCERCFNLSDDNLCTVCNDTKRDATKICVVEDAVTALYISRCLRPLDITVTRIASGLPVGSDLEFADELTLGRALSNRTPIED